MKIPDPIFPPLLKGHPVESDQDAFETACGGAVSGRLGAGDVVWSRNPYTLDLAIVLEPDVPAATAVQMMPLLMVAVGDSIGALTPPQVGQTFTWPDIVRINGGEAGVVRGALPKDASPDTAPAWLVVGFGMRHMRGPKDPEPGEVPDITWLGEEGGGELTRTDMIESFCRHFLTWLNHWDDEGFKPVHESWTYRAEERGGDITVESGGESVTGAFVGLDDGGNLLVRRDGRHISFALLDRFERR
ncbi:MAG: biotin/lipoate--protein ligase family protein [Hyphomicrobiales bacterium]